MWDLIWVTVVGSDYQLAEDTKFFVVLISGNAYTKGVRKFDNDVFTHSIEERTDFIKDFLKELGISRCLTLNAPITTKVVCCNV